MADSVLPPVEYQICYALYTTHMAMNRLYRKALKKTGLTYPQYLVLQVLWEQDGVDLSTIGARLTLDSATLTPLLKRLERQGFVGRSRDPGDERHVILTLTDKGRQLRRAVSDVPSVVMDAAGCGADELSELMAQLGKLRENLTRDDQ